MKPRRYTDKEIDEANATIALSELIGKRVKLTQHGAEHVGLCPFHAEKSPSFTVNDDKGFFHCFGCGAHGNAVGFLMRADNLSFPEAVRELRAGLPSDPKEIERIELDRSRKQAEVLSKAQENIAIARRCWERAKIIVPGDPVWRYLHGRACLVSPVPPVLRFAPAMWHAYFMADGGPIRTWPAMLARVDNVAGEMTGLHMTYLVEAGDGRVTQDPELKARNLSKMTKGTIRGGAIRLYESSGDLGVDEGIENAFSMYQMRGGELPFWAMPSHGHLGAFEIPPWCSRLDIHSQRDKPQICRTCAGTRRHNGQRCPDCEGKTHAPEGVGMLSARKLQRRAREMNVAERVYLPIDGHKDSNDAWRARLAERGGDRQGTMRAGSVEAVVAP